MKRIFLLILLLLITLTAPASGDLVDSSTGYFMHEHTDLHIPGIIPVNIKRYYRNREGGTATQGTTYGLGIFGKGTYFEYDWWLGDYGDMLLLIKPGNYQYAFVKQPDGTYLNTTDPEFRGSTITNNGDNTKTLKMSAGWKYKFNYNDSNGNLISIEDRNGNQLTLARRSNYEGGYLTKITTAEGKTITFSQTYTNSFFRTNSISDSDGRTVTYTYESDPFSPYPRLKYVTYLDGSTIQYEYDAQGRMSGVINQRGIREVFNEYTSDNRVYRQTHADGGVFTFNYTTAGGNITETSMTEPNGAVTIWRFYDDSGAYRDGYITRITTSDGITKYERESGTNLLLKVTDPLLRETTYNYYPDGHIHTITDNTGNVTTYEYESIYGMPTKITNALGKETTYAYTFDGSNRITKTEIRDPLQKLTTINYNSYGLPVSITDPNLNTTSLYYENATNPSQLTKIIDPLNNASIIHYDSLGRQDLTTDAKEKTTYYIYDFMGRLKEVTDPLYGTTIYSYDLNGNLLSVIDPKNHVIRYEYDERDRVKKMKDQLGKIETYAYDTSDRLTSVTDRKGQITTFNEYDLMNRLKKVTYHDGSYTDYVYDTVGKLMSITDSVSGAISYTYSGTGCGSGCSSVADKIESETTPLGSISYTYDEIGRRKAMQVAGQPIINYNYDDAGKMTNINSLINSTLMNFNIGYDDAGRRTSLSLPNGVTTSYAYDNASRLLGLEHKDALNTIFESIGYNYDANGNRINMDRPTVTLPSREPVTSASYNDANQMLTFNDKNIVYDDNGNMTNVTNTCGTTTYSWNVRNQLVGISGFKADCSSLTAAFNYDALGRRIEKTINGDTTKYLYDGLDIVQEIKNNTVYANYIRTMNIDEPLSRIKADGTIRFYQRDALGSVIALTDETGVIKTQYSYDPFGNVTISGEASDNPFQYTGRENDGTGLYYYRARYYSPELQRFISEDPIGFNSGDVNFYAYVGNNPVKFRDSFGLFKIPDFGAIANFLKCMATCIQFRFSEAPYGPNSITDLGTTLNNLSRAFIMCKDDCKPPCGFLKDVEFEMKASPNQQQVAVSMSVGLAVAIVVVIIIVPK